MEVVSMDSQIGLAFAIGSFVLMLFDLFFVLLYTRAHNKKIPSKAIMLLLAFAANVLLWMGILRMDNSYVCAVVSSSCKNETAPDGMAALFKAFGNAAKMFTLTVGDSDFPTIFMANLNSTANWLIRIFTYLDEVFAFFFISFAIVAVVFRTFAGMVVNSFWYLFGHHRHFHDHYIDYIFTDLPFEELYDFIVYSHRKGDKVIVVLSESSQLTQVGTELKNVLLAHFVRVKTGMVRKEYLASLNRSHFPGRPIRFYGCYAHDNDALVFAEAALGFTRANEKKSCPFVSHNYFFYVSHQDPDIEKKYNFESDSHGKIRFFSEYEWAATKFVFEEPLYRLYDSNFIKVGLSQKERDEGPLYHVELLGFGGINQAMLRRMLSAYQGTGNENRVRYHIVSSLPDKKDDGPASATPLIDAFLARRPAFRDKKDWHDSYACLPLLEAPLISESHLDLMDDHSLRQYGNQLWQDVLGQGEQALLVVALGDSETNCRIASALRDYFTQRNLVSSDQNGKGPLRVNSEMKSIIIAPYVKERNLFAPDFSSISHDLFLLYNREQKGKDLTTEVENHRLYVFEARANFFSAGDSLPRKIAKKMKKQKNDNVQSTLREDFTLKKGQTEEKELPGHHVWTQNDFKDYRAMTFKHEAVPLVCFGRGGYFVDDNDAHLIALAERCATIYDSSYDSKKIGQVAVGPFTYFDRPSVARCWGRSALPGDRLSNFSHVSVLPEKLSLFGVRLVLSPRRSFHKEEAKEETKRTIECLLDVRKRIATPSVSEVLEGTKEELSPSQLLATIADPQLAQACLEHYRQLHPEKNGAIEESTKVNKTFRAYLVNYLLSELSHLLFEAYPSPFKAPLPAKKIPSFGVGECPIDDKTSIPWQTIVLRVKETGAEKKAKRYLHWIYAFLYEMPSNPYQDILAELEHNRWYGFQADAGVLPMPLHRLAIAQMAVASPVLEKTYLKDIHACETSNAGLGELKDILLENMAFNPYYFSPKIPSEPGKANTYPFVFEELERIHGLIYRNDTFTLSSLSSLLALSKKKLPVGSPVAVGAELEESEALVDACQKAHVVFDFGLEKVNPWPPLP